MPTLKKLFSAGSQKFYRLFQQMAENVLLMEQMFIQFLYENDLAIASEHLRKLEQVGHQTDATTRQLIIELGRNFITPFDREDIHALTSTLDDIADYMYAIAKQRINYRILNTPRESQLIADKQKMAAKLLCEILNSLDDKNLVKFAVLSQEVKNILRECDNMIDVALNALYSQQKDTIEAIKLTDHFNYMQALIDKSEDAANTIESIIIKYS